MGIIDPLLTMKASRYSLQGSSAYGEVFETQEDEFRCRIEPSSKRVSTDGTNETISSARLFCKKQQTINIGDKIVWNDGENGAITYYVLTKNVIMGFNKVSHYECELGLDVQ